MKKEIFRERVMPLFGISLLIMALGSMASKSLSFVFTTRGLFIVVIMEFVLLILSMLMKRKEPWNKILLFLFAFVTGLTSAPIFVLAFSIDPKLLVEAFIITSVFFFSLVLYSLKTKKDFRSLGGFLLALLVVTIVASIIDIFFMKNRIFSLGLDIIVILIFLGMILYDMSRILRDYNDEDYTAATIALYLDFLNIFIRILSFLLKAKERE